MRLRGVQLGRQFEVAVLLVEVGGDCFAPRDVFVDVGQCRQSSGCAVGLADGDRTVEPHDRSVGEAEQLVVPLDDLDPVGLLDTRCVGVERGDRRLRLVFAELIARERGLCDGDAFGDELGVPLAAVLFGEGHDAPVRSGAAAAAGMMEEHQGEQPVDLGVVDQRGQLAGQPNRLGGEVEVAGVPLVEDEVQHPHHRGHVAGAVDAGATDDALGAADALRHGGLGHEVGPGDLACGEATHGAQGQRNRRRRRQVRVGAQEVEVQRVVGARGRAGRRFGVESDLAVAAGGVRPRMSRKARHATVMSHPVGSAGDSSAHAACARMSASWVASSAVAKSAPRPTRTLNTRGTSWRSSTSSTITG